ncbi:MAG: radical SAM protein [Ignavibacteria bacterium]|nr:MAG: radical SAM protein [Ignavibacteria bacterium]
MLKVNEIYYSLQGESTYAGLPCVFVRLTYCNLRCSYCDTEYAFYEGKDMSVSDIIKKVESYDCNLVEVTGGEPLFQEESIDLMKKLCDAGYEVMLETGGHMSVENVDERVKIIMDVKTPSSKMSKKNLFSNFEKLKNSDELKFVIGTREDYEWSKSVLEQYSLTDKFTVLFSSVYGKLSNKDLAEWIIEDKLKVRFQLQNHKYIWEPDSRGV